MDETCRSCGAPTSRIVPFMLFVAFIVIATVVVMAYRERANSANVKAAAARFKESRLRTTEPVKQASEPVEQVNEPVTLNDDE